jgi:dCTP deaminase
VKIYPGVQICQLFFHQIHGDITEYSSAKYQHNRDIQPSMLFRELSPDADGEQQLHLEFGAERGAPVESALPRGPAASRIP